MKRFFTLVLEALALVAVALISAFIAMRLAIHGREAVVPTLSGLTVSEANSLAKRQGLNLNLENTFYSADVPAGHILAQDPAAGSRVRRDWPVRITESLGAQRVDIPDLTGQTERAATIDIRRLSLELGAVAHLAIGGDPDVVLTQTPPANTGGVDGPRVSLLVSDPLPQDAQPPAYAMPSLVGLSYTTAGARAAGTGLHMVAVTQNAPPAAITATPAAASTVTAPATADATSATSPAPADNPPVAATRSSGIVIAQTPLAGSRVLQGDTVHVTLSHPAPPTATSPAQPAALPAPGN
jgi:beta-lactam-binding protein with PASTA domain